MPTPTIIPSNLASETGETITDFNARVTTPFLEQKAKLHTALTSLAEEIDNPELKEELLVHLNRVKPHRVESSHRLKPDQIFYAHLRAIKLLQQNLCTLYTNETDGAAKATLGAMIVKVQHSDCAPDNFSFTSRQLQAGLNKVAVPVIKATTTVPRTGRLSSLFFNERTTSDPAALAAAKPNQIRIQLTARKEAPSTAPVRRGASS